MIVCLALCSAFLLHPHLKNKLTLWNKRLKEHKYHKIEGRLQHVMFWSWSSHNNYGLSCCHYLNWACCQVQAFLDELLATKFLGVGRDIVFSHVLIGQPNRLHWIVQTSATGAALTKLCGLQNNTTWHEYKKGTTMEEESWLD